MFKYNYNLRIQNVQRGITLYKLQNLPFIIQIIQRKHLCISVLLFFCSFGMAQDSLHILEPAPNFHKGRFYTGLALGTTAYGVTLYGLNSAWYKESPSTRFHFRDDYGAWENVDKAGHVFTAYFESAWVSNSLEWAGVPRNTAIWYGAGAGMLFQTTVEVMDGFSDRWGFSWSDMGANLLGSSAFLAQEYLWQEQRIKLKWSVQNVAYSTQALTSENGMGLSSPLRRAESLFGTSTTERLLKDYNGQITWASVSIADFLPASSVWPEWLAVSTGYGAKNLYGGYGNRWTEDNAVFDLSSSERTRQFYIGPDVDWSKIQTRSRWLNTLFEMLNVLRLPFPALEINNRGEVIWHWVLL